MNAREIAEVIADYLIDNSEYVICAIKSRDVEELVDEICTELTEE